MTKQREARENNNPSFATDTGPFIERMYYTAFEEIRMDRETAPLGTRSTFSLLFSTLVATDTRPFMEGKPKGGV